MAATAATATTTDDDSNSQNNAFEHALCEPQQRVLTQHQQHQQQPLYPIHPFILPAPCTTHMHSTYAPIQPQHQPPIRTIPPSPHHPQPPTTTAPPETARTAAAATTTTTTTPTPTNQPTDHPTKQHGETDPRGGHFLIFFVKALISLLAEAGTAQCCNKIRQMVESLACHIFGRLGPMFWDITRCRLSETSAGYLPILAIRSIHLLLLQTLCSSLHTRADL